jgi:two-component system OmpR family response regulator
MLSPQRETEKEGVVAPVSGAGETATLMIVDDDPVIRERLAQSLGKRGYHVVTAGNAGEMDRMLASLPVDVIILDIMMPGEDGLSACRRLAAVGGPPVILLSALGEEEDRILGLEIGAEHYLSKPCSAREIVANVRTLLRRRYQPAQQRNVRFFQGWRIDLDSNELFDSEGALIDLTDGEFSVLRVFVERPRRVLTRDQLLQAARGPQTDSFDRAIDIQISRLRRKLAAPGDSLIRTIRNEGYMLVAAVSTVMQPR